MADRPPGSAGTPPPSYEEVMTNPTHWYLTESGSDGNDAEPEVVMPPAYPQPANTRRVSFYQTNHSNGAMPPPEYPETASRIPEYKRIRQVDQPDTNYIASYETPAPNPSSTIDQDPQPSTDRRSDSLATAEATNQTPTTQPAVVVSQPRSQTLEELIAENDRQWYCDDEALLETKPLMKYKWMKARKAEGKCTGDPAVQTLCKMVSLIPAVIPPLWSLLSLMKAKPTADNPSIPNKSQLAYDSERNKKAREEAMIIVKNQLRVEGTVPHNQGYNILPMQLFNYYTLFTCLVLMTNIAIFTTHCKSFPETEGYIQSGVIVSVICVVIIFINGVRTLNDTVKFRKEYDLDKQVFHMVLSELAMSTPLIVVVQHWGATTRPYLLGIIYYMDAACLLILAFTRSIRILLCCYRGIKLTGLNTITVAHYFFPKLVVFLFSSFVSMALLLIGQSMSLSSEIHRTHTAIQGLYTVIPCASMGLFFIAYSYDRQLICWLVLVKHGSQSNQSRTHIIEHLKLHPFLKRVYSIEPGLLPLLITVLSSFQIAVCVLSIAFYSYTEFFPLRQILILVSNGLAIISLHRVYLSSAPMFALSIALSAAVIVIAIAAMALTWLISIIIIVFRAICNALKECKK